MRRVRRDPINLEDIELETNLPGRPGATRRVLSHDEESGSTTLLQTMRVGYRPPNGEAPESRRFELHTCHEELFVLDGTFNFGPWYSLKALAYLNHPPYWVHPAAQYAETDVALLIKFSGPLDFFFEDIPEAWDGVEFVHGSAPVDATRRGASNIHVDDLGWTPAISGQGENLGYDVKHLWDDQRSGWSTYLQSFPAGWQGVRDAAAEDGGDEWLMLSGAVQLDDGLALRAGDYFCDPEKVYDGGHAAKSETGATAIRWRRGAPLRVGV